MKRPTLALLAIALSTSGVAGADTAPNVDAKPRETFAVVWDRLQNSGFKGEHEGLDWAALKAEHQPEIERPPTSGSCARRSTSCSKTSRPRISR